jgi:hypothetical protein
MLHITHRQTTAYHPESNGAVKRLQRRLKDALCSRTTAATWDKEIPWVLLGLRAQSREDTGLSLAEAVFGAPIVLLNEFLKGDETPVHTILKKFLKSLDAPAFSLPRHNSSHQLPSELPAYILSAHLSRSGAAVWFPFSTPPRPPLCCPPPGTLRLHPTGRAARGDHGVGRPKACTAMDATPSNARCRSRPPGPGTMAMPAAARPGSLGASKQVWFSDPLISSPSQQEQPRIHPETIFLQPHGEVFANPGPAAPSQPPQRRYPQRQRKLPTRIDL